MTNAQSPTPECAHLRWTLASPNGSAYVEGVCKECGEVKQFPASIEEDPKVRLRPERAMKRHTSYF